MSEAKENGTAAPNPTPQWLKADLFEDHMRKNVAGYKQIKNFKAAPGLAAGENYATLMLKLEFEIELNDSTDAAYSLMLKLGHDSEMYKSMIKRNNIFAVENEVYQNIAPELEQIYRDAGVEVKFGAKGYEFEAPEDYVLLENLAVKGFKNTNRLECLDIEHTQCVLRKIAQWHAASAVRIATNGPYPANITRGFINKENKQVLDEIFKKTSKPFLECVNSYKGHEEYTEQMEAMQSRITDGLINISQADPNEFNVLNHGDLWSNNIMFQYDANGKIKETYLVDFQMIKYGTVAHDLIYFLLSSTKLELKMSKFDYFVKYYHEQLIEHLTQLKYNKTLPKLRDIHSSIFRYGLWGYCVVTGVMAAVLVDPTEEASFDNFVGDSAEGESFKNLMYSNARYRKHIEALLPWLLNRGAIDA